MCPASIFSLVLCVLTTVTASRWAESQQLQASSTGPRWHAGHDPSDMNERISIKEEVCDRNYAVEARPLTIQTLTLPYLTSPASLLGANQPLRHDRNHDECFVSSSASLCPRCLCQVELRRPVQLSERVLAWPGHKLRLTFECSSWKAAAETGCCPFLNSVLRNPITGSTLNSWGPRVHFHGFDLLMHCLRGKGASV